MRTGFAKHAPLRLPEKYPFGMDLRDGTLIREDGSGLLFLILDGKLSVIENSDIIDATNATTLDPARLDLLRTDAGPPIARDAHLATADGKNFLVNNGQKRPFTTAEAIRRYHFHPHKFTPHSPTSLPTPTGPPLTP